MSSGKSKVLSSAKRGTKDRIMELEIENSRLQRLVAELLSKNQQLRMRIYQTRAITEKFDHNLKPATLGVIPAGLSSCV
jgi:hypothetical protein